MMNKDDAKRLGDEAVYIKDQMDAILNSVECLSEGYAVEKITKAKRAVSRMMTIVGGESE